MIVVLVGQPNSGKSTIFNSVAGYRTAVANFPGTTVEFTCSTVGCGGKRFELAEIPGIYSMSSSSEDERQARDRLLDLGPDVIVNVIDASLLGRSLELTLELLDLGRPLVVCLNMMDEAQRKGIRIDTDHLSRDLGVPVIPAVARKVGFRLREFVVIAWPILIAGSVVLSLLDHFDLSAAVNGALSPLTGWLLGLPAETGITLVFGILRKELTIVMHVQALGTSDFASVLTTGQMAVFTAFSLFYVPCLATLAALRSVIGARGMLAALGLTTAAAVVIAVAVRLVFLVFA